MKTEEYEEDINFLKLVTVRGSAVVELCVTAELRREDRAVSSSPAPGCQETSSDPASAPPRLATC